jgi:LPXTG-motif cell wall-anchored protein
MNGPPGRWPSRHSARDRRAGPKRSFRRALAVVTAAAALAAAIPALPAGAAGSGGFGGFGLTPAPASDGQVAPYFMLTLAAGHSAVAITRISDTAKRTEKLLVSRSTGGTAPTGGSTFNRPFLSCSGPGCWVTGLPKAVTLSAGSDKLLSFTVHVPRGTAHGQYLAGITAELAARPRPVKVGSNGKASAKAIIIDQITVGVAITVGSLSQLTTRMQVPGVSAGVIGTTGRLNVQVANTGQTFASAAGTASCTVTGKRYSVPVNVATILPGDRAVAVINAPRLKEGATVPCRVRLGYGHGQVATWAGSVTVPSPPRTRIVHTGPGAYSVLPAGGVPTWAIALLVIGVLVLAALAVLLLRRRRHSPAG